MLIRPYLKKNCFFSFLVWNLKNMSIFAPTNASTMSVSQNTRYYNPAGVAKLVDVPDLGSGAARRVGSSPITRTKAQTYVWAFFMVACK